LASTEKTRTTSSPLTTRVTIHPPVAPAAIYDVAGDSPRKIERAIHRRHVLAAEMAAREMGGLSLADALLLCELLAAVDPARYERAALRWLERFIDERLPPLAEVALAASALAELRHGHRNIGLQTAQAIGAGRRSASVKSDEEASLACASSVASPLIASAQSAKAGLCLFAARTLPGRSKSRTREPQNRAQTADGACDGD
jgi:hypothetical protein